MQEGATCCDADQRGDLQLLEFNIGRAWDSFSVDELKRQAVTMFLTASQGQCGTPKEKESPAAGADGDRTLNPVAPPP